MPRVSKKLSTTSKRSSNASRSLGDGRGGFPNARPLAGEERSRGVGCRAYWLPRLQVVRSERQQGLGSDARSAARAGAMRVPSFWREAGLRGSAVEEGGPRLDGLQGEHPVLCPVVLRQPVTYCLLRRSGDCVQHLPTTLERSSEDNEAVLHERIHKPRMLVPS